MKKHLRDDKIAISLNLHMCEQVQGETNQQKSKVENIMTKYGQNRGHLKQPK